MKSNLLIALVGIVLLWSGAHWFEKLNHIYRLTPMGQLVQAAAFAAACTGALVVVWGCCRRETLSDHGKAAYIRGFQKGYHKPRASGS